MADQRDGVVAAMSVVANVSLASLGDVSRAGLIRRREERALADRFGSRSVLIPGLVLTGGAFAAFGLLTPSLTHWFATWVVFTLVQLLNPMQEGRRKFEENPKLAWDILEAGTERARKTAGMASRINFILSIPMLMCMGGQAHGLPF